MNAARQVLEKVMAARGQVDSHPGLLLQRFQDKISTDEDKAPEAKSALLQTAIGASRHEDVRKLYALAYERWRVGLGEQAFVQVLDLQVDGRLIVGLGSENVLETGITLHHTYGMPIIPGSALKGLAAHYCDRMWGDRENANPSEEARDYRDARKGNRNAPAEHQGDYHNVLFGSTQESGCIAFHDAWFVPESSKSPLVLDVMTPHHTGWNDTKKPVAPTDFDNPNPVPFVSVTGTFRVAVSWCGPANEDAGCWTRRAFELLCEALCDWGVGGKTSSGYGRLAPPPPPPPPKKRNSSDRAQVKILARRPKGGFDVQDVEPGRLQGTLTVGTPPAGTNVEVGEIVDVLIHIDDQKRPQYKWPQTSKK